MGRVWRGCRLHIYVQSLPDLYPRWITIAVRVVVGGTSGRDVFSLRRLRKLPDVCVVNSALGRTWRWVRKSAARRRWAGVVGDPEDDLSPACILANVIGGDD